MAKPPKSPADAADDAANETATGADVPAANDAAATQDGASGAEGALPAEDAANDGTKGGDSPTTDVPVGQDAPAGDGAGEADASGQTEVSQGQKFTPTSIDFQHPVLSEPVRVTTDALKQPEIIVHADLPIEIDARWIDQFDDNGTALPRAILVTAVPLPGFQIVAPEKLTPLLDAAADALAAGAGLVTFDPETLLDWRELEDGTIVGVTHDGRKVRGRFA